MPTSPDAVVAIKNDWLTSPFRKEEIDFSCGMTFLTGEVLSRISNFLIKNSRKEKVCFCVEKELPVSSIDVTVKHIGKLQFPVAEELLKKLASNSTKVKFPKECNINEIKTDKLNVTINNDLFEIFLKEISQELGFPEATSLEPHLYNMLIHGPGQYFKYPDGLHADDLIVTLIIVLPVEHDGGELIVTHNKEKHVFYTDDIDTNNFKCAAFYADCCHAVGKITQGYQIALTYNLISLPKDTHYSHYSNLELEKLMKKYFSDEEVNEYNFDLNLMYLLNHSYTEHNLRWNTLKGIDIKYGSAMYNAAQKLNLVPHLVLVEISINYDEDDEYGKEIPFLTEEDYEGNFWIDSNNKKVFYGKFTSQFICYTTETKNFEPYDVEYNEGDGLPNVDRYRRAAIVVWPVSNDIRMKFILNYTKEKIQFFEMLHVSSKQEKIVQIILNVRKYLHDKESLKQKDYLVFLVDFAINVDDRKVALELLSYFLWQILDLNIAICFLKLESKYTISFVIELLQIWSKNKESYLLKNICDIVTNLVAVNVNIELIQLILEKQRIYLTEPNSVFNSMNNSKRVNGIKTLLNACELVNDFHAGTIQHSLVDFLTSYGFDFKKYIVPLISDLKKNDMLIGTPWFQRLKNYAISEITKKRLQFYKLPNDWSVICSISCKCNYCLILNQFVLSKHKTKKILSCLDRATCRHIQQSLKNLTANSFNITIEGQYPKSKIILLKTKKLHLGFRNDFNKYNLYLSDINNC